jgi:hypothetical protein
VGFSNARGGAYKKQRPERKDETMPQKALDAGIGWKLGFLQARLNHAQLQLAADKTADPVDEAKVADDEALVRRCKDEQEVVKGPNRGGAYDLVKRNLEVQIAIEKRNLSDLEEFYTKEKTVDREKTAAQRRVIAALKELLDALVEEGRP